MPRYGSFISHRGLAAELGVSRYTVADCVRLLKLTPKPMQIGKAKGLDAADVRKIRAMLRLPAKAREPVPA